MSDININDLMNQMRNEYPDWVNKGIGSEVQALTKAINSLNNSVKAGNKAAGDAEKRKKKSDADLLNETKRNTDEQIKTQSVYKKFMTSSLKKRDEAADKFKKGDISGATQSIKDSVKDGINGLGKLGVGLNLAGVALSTLAGKVGDIYTEMEKSRNVYSDLNNQGLLVKGGFMELRKATTASKMSIEQLSTAMTKSSTAIIAMGDNGVQTFGKLSLSLRKVDGMANKFGMGIKDVNEYLASYLDNQRVVGIINKMNERERIASAERGIKELTAFSSILGKSRDQILKDSQQFFTDPKFRNLTARTIESMGLDEKNAAKFKDGMSSFINMLSSSMGPEQAEKIVGVLMSGYASGKGVVDLSHERRQELAQMANINKEALDVLIGAFSDAVEGRINDSNMESHLGKVGGSLQKLTTSLDKSIEGVVLFAEGSNGSLKGIAETFSGIQVNMSGIEDWSRHFANSWKKTAEVADAETNNALKGVQAMENANQEIITLGNEAANAAISTTGFTHAIEKATEAVNYFAERRWVKTQDQLHESPAVKDIIKTHTGGDTQGKFNDSLFKRSKREQIERQLAELEAKENKKGSDLQSIWALKKKLEELPKLAKGGVANQRMYAEIAEAGNPEMVMPLDPSLHNMAKYNAEMMVDIYGPFQRQILKQFSGYFFKENALQIDDIFTKTLGRFFFTKNDVIQELTAASAGQGSLATQNLMRVMGLDVSQASGGSFASSRQADAEYAASVGSGQTQSTGAAKIESEAGRRIYQKLIDKGLQPHIASAFVHNFMDESGLNSGINEKNPLVPGSRGGYGLYQLTGPRRKQYEAFAKKNGYRFDDEDAQIEFMMQELKTTEKDAWDKISRTGNTAEAAQSIVKNFLRPAPQHRNSRMAKYGRLQDGPIMGASNGVASSGDYLFYSNKNATRNKPINAKLQDAMSFVGDMGLKMEVYSGGQDGKGEGNRRTGSVRHDHGNAADVKFYKDGKILDFNNPEHRPIFEEIVTRAKQRGVTGIGAGANYMGTKSMHVGFGKAAVWGAKGEKAPEWLSNAYYNGKNYPDLGTAGPQLAGYSPGSTSFGMLGKSGGTMMTPDSYNRIDWGGASGGSDEHSHGASEAVASSDTSGSQDMLSIGPLLEKLNRNIEELARAYRKGNGVLST